MSFMNRSEFFSGPIHERVAGNAHEHGPGDLERIAAPARCVSG